MYSFIFDPNLGSNNPALLGQFIHSKTNLICSPIEKLIKHNALFSWLFLSLKKKKKEEAAA